MCLFYLGVVLGQERWGLPELMSELGTVRSVEANFVERKYLSVLDAPLEVSGTLAYRAPRWLEKRTLRPTGETIRLDGDSLTIENATPSGKRTYALQRNPVLSALIESIRSTLAGDLETLQHFYDVALHGSRADWSLQLTPTDESMRSSVRQIGINGRGGWVYRVEILNAVGDRSVMTITPKQP